MLWKVLRSRPQPSVVDIAASAGARRIYHSPLIVNQIHIKIHLFQHNYAPTKYEFRGTRC